MDRRQFLKTLGILLAGGASAVSVGHLVSQLSANKTRRPNFLFIMADDLSCHTLGCYGGTTFDTPHIDRLAQGGMRFTRCYSTPFCITSRVQTLTGRYQYHTGWYSFNSLNRKKFLDPTSEPTYAQFLKAAGYYTAVAGKWQLCDNLADYPDHPVDCGFDEYCLFHHSEKFGYHDPILWINGKLYNDEYQGQFGPDIYTDFLIDFIRRHQAGPFFVSYPMLLCHGPYIWPQVDRFYTSNTDQQIARQRKYADMVHYMDKLVGRLVETLRSLKLLDNTYIIFTADNGTPKGFTMALHDGKVLEGGKGSLSDTGIHIPLVVYQPKTIQPGQTCEALVDLSDFFPTFLELANIYLPENHLLDGMSFAHHLKAQPGPRREWVYSAYENLHSIQTQDWKYETNGKEHRLYDLRQDPYGEHPVTTDSHEATQMREKLQGILNARQMMTVYD